MTTVWGARRTPTPTLEISGFFLAKWVGGKDASEFGKPLFCRNARKCGAHKREPRLNVVRCEAQKALRSSGKAADAERERTSRFLLIRKLSCGRWDLRHAAQIDHRQMWPSPECPHDERELVASLCAAARHPGSGFEPSSRDHSAGVGLFGCPPVQPFVGPRDVVPAGVSAQLSPHRSVGQRDERQPSRAFLFQRADEPLDNADAGRLAEPAVARPDPGRLHQRLNDRHQNWQPRSVMMYRGV